MTSIALLNLFAWSLQVAVVVAAAGLIARLLHVDAPGARYAWWRLVLVLCLALPVLQPWQHRAAATDTPVVADTGAGTSSEGLTAPATALAEVSTRPNRRGTGAALITAILALGIAGRLAWLAAGLYRLRRLRQSKPGAGCSDLYGEVQALMQVHAEFRCVDALRQPATFGILRPVVLLPASLAAFPEDVRRAVVAHELCHVRRRDWAWVLAEEALRSLLWFHPAMWWLISRVQSSREEVVDELTVLITHARRSYLEALLAFADQPRTFPATPFAQRKHLFTRMLLVSKEAAMSSRRIVGSCAGMLLGVVLAGSYAAAAFPLTTPAPAAGAAAEQTPPRDRRPNEPGPATQREIALEARLKGAADGGAQTEPGRWVELARLQEQRGAIAMAESTLLEMRRAQPGKTESYHALAGLYQRTGQFDRGIGVLDEATALNPSDPNGYQIIVTFLSERAKDPSLAAADRLSYIRQGIAAADRALAVKPAFLEAMVYKSLLLRTQAGLESDVTAQQGLLREADSLRNQALALRQSSPAQMTFAPAAGGPPPPPPPPPPAPSAVASNPGGTKPLRVGGTLGVPTKIKHVPPVYPEDARAAGVQGVVILEAVIDEVGAVSSARVLRSIPLLDEAALDAVRQWQFTPTLLNGAPVSVMMTITINFTTQ
jgi:TonB family protein